MPDDKPLIVEEVAVLFLHLEGIDGIIIINLPYRRIEPL